MRRISVPVALLTAALLSACGSTAQQTSALQQAGGGAATTDGLGGAGATDGVSGVGPGATSDSGTSGPGGIGGSIGGSTGAGSGVAGSTQGGAGSGSGGTAGGTTGTRGSGADAGPSVAVGPGVTATEIRLGIPFCNDCSAANSAVGAGGEDPGDTRRYYKAALDEVNARGGVIGRKLVPVFHEVSASDNISESQQAACETFNKDNKVLITYFRGEIIYECTKKAGTIAWGTGASGPVFDRYPNLFAPSAIAFERLGAVTVKAMVRAGWHKPEPKYPTGKIGIISWDSNEYRFAMDKGWIPALREAGLKEALPVRYIAIPQSDSSIADAAPAISAAVLAFRNAGVDHVLISDGPAGIFTGAGLTFLFLQNAKSQRYFPRYGMNSNNAPDFDSHPKDQLVGMLAVDSFDTAPANDEGIALNPQRERCFAVMKKKGLPVGQGQTQFLASGACEIAFFSEAIIKASKSTLLPDMIAGGEALGTSYRSPFNYGNRLGRGRHDGVALFRNLRFDEACSCIKYTSKPYEP